jgi:hypothetical protein
MIRRIGTDHRCDVHQMALGIRDGKEGWFYLFSPSFSACSDDGELWGLMVSCTSVWTSRPSDRHKRVQNNSFLQMNSCPPSHLSTPARHSLSLLTC